MPLGVAPTTGKAPVRQTMGAPTKAPVLQTSQAPRAPAPIPGGGQPGGGAPRPAPGPGGVPGSGAPGSNGAGGYTPNRPSGPAPIPGGGQPGGARPPIYANPPAPGSGGPGTNGTTASPTAPITNYGPYVPGQGPGGAASQDPFVQWLKSQEAINASQAAQNQANLDVNQFQAYTGMTTDVNNLNSAAQYDAKYLNFDINRLNADQGYSTAVSKNLDDTNTNNYNRYLSNITTNNNQAQANYDTHALARAAVEQGYGRQLRGNLTDNTARGSTMSQGFGEAVDDIRFNRDQGNGEADLRRRTADEAVGTSNRNNQLGWESNQNQYALGQAAQVRQNSYLDTLGKEYGVKGSQIQERLKQAVEKSGMDYAQVIQKLTEMSQSNNAASAAQASALTYQLLSLGKK